MVFTIYIIKYIYPIILYRYSKKKKEKRMIYFDGFERYPFNYSNTHAMIIPHNIIYIYQYVCLNTIKLKELTLIQYNM